MSQIKLTADSGGGTTSIKAPSSTTSNADVVLKLPVADGSANQVLKTDGSGQLSFTSNAGTTINNNADNRIITGSGTANTLEAESSITYDGTKILNISSSAGGFFQGTDTDGGVGLVEMGNGNVALQADTGNAIANSKIQFLVDNSEKMTLLDSGKLGIGTTSPAERLHVYESSGAAVIRLEPGHSNGQAFNILSTYGSAANTGNFSIRNESGSAFLDLQHNEGTPRMQVRNGTGNVHAQIDADGIKFNGDTAAANGLDDYEEGTWTPVMKKYVNSSWVNATMTNNGTVQFAKYTKVGNKVQIFLRWDGWQQSDANYCVIGGLPFSSVGGGVIVPAYNDCFTNNQNQGGLVGNGSTNISFYYNSNAWNGWSSSSARTLYCGGIYFASA